MIIIAIIIIIIIIIITDNNNNNERGKGEKTQRKKKNQIINVLLRTVYTQLALLIVYGNYLLSRVSINPLTFLDKHVYTYILEDKVQVTNL